jgi:signal transduction histidine kinase
VRGVPIRDRDGEVREWVGTITDVTERKKAEEERERLRVREWAARAETAERERISRELHDRVAHSMGVVHQSLQLYEALAGTDPARAAGKLELAREMAKTSLDATRNLSAELRRSETEEGLVPALRHLLEVSVPDVIRRELSVGGEDSPLPEPLRGQVYLILREAVRNAVRHSRCSRIKVGLEIAPEEVAASVEDDGRGLACNGAEPAGLGLRSMRERTALLAGTLEVSSTPGSGTRVEVRVPFQERRGE